MLNFIAGFIFGGLFGGFAVYVVLELRALKLPRQIEPLGVRLAKEQLAAVDKAMDDSAHPEPAFKLGAMGPTMTRAMDELRRQTKENQTRPEFVPTALNPDIKVPTEPEIIEAAKKATGSNGNR